MSLPILVRNHLSLSSILLLGAAIQCLLSSILPMRYAITPALLLLSLRFISNALIARGIVRNPYLDGNLHGRWTASLPNDDGTIPQTTGDKEVVVFIVGASSNHPMGLFAPGMDKINIHWQAMWKDLEAHRDQNGC